MIAEYERAQITERTQRGKAHRARAGSVNVLGAAPYGFRYHRRSDDADARYEIVPAEAAVVRELFRRYVEDQASIADLGWVNRRWTLRSLVGLDSGFTLLTNDGPSVALAIARAIDQTDDRWPPGRQRSIP